MVKNIVIVLLLGVSIYFGASMYFEVHKSSLDMPFQGDIVPSDYSSEDISEKSSPTEVRAPSPVVATKPVATIQGSFLGSSKKSTLSLGDSKYVTDRPKKGYIYLCNARSDEGVGGAGKDGPWITGSTWNPEKKIAVSGSVSWSNALMNVTVTNGMRTFTTNDLPKTHTTGIYPVSSSDAAYTYDRNPNSIKVQSLSLSVPVAPALLSSPVCIGGEVGIMTSGSVLFNAFDALLRDAVAHEVQDSCDGHPQVSGMYHYHGPSKCFKDSALSTVIGYAFDGFPITGSSVGDGKYLFTDDLDECHGLTSEIMLDGKMTKTYHYVMTQDFPYSVGCFRGKSQVNGPLGGAPTGGGQGQQGGQQETPQQGGGGGTPPQEAISACSGKSDSVSCSFSTPNGTMSGVCHTPPGQSSLACVPQH